MNNIEIKKSIYIYNIIIKFQFIFMSCFFCYLLLIFIMVGLISYIANSQYTRSEIVKSFQSLTSQWSGDSSINNQSIICNNSNNNNPNNNNSNNNNPNNNNPNNNNNNNSNNNNNNNSNNNNSNNSNNNNSNNPNDNDIDTDDNNNLNNNIEPINDDTNDLIDLDNITDEILIDDEYTSNYDNNRDDNIDNDDDTTIPSKTKEVYFVVSNIYDPSDAERICNVFGGKLASESDMNDAYNKGADWCNIGWIKDNHTAYPVQNSTCGIKGINLTSHYSSKKYGVNCYGIKPSKKKIDSLFQSTSYNNYHDKKITDGKPILLSNKELKLLTPILPFNDKTWTLNKRTHS